MHGGTAARHRYVYFARPDSVMNGVGIYESRLRMGEYLGRRVLKLYPQHDIDVVIPIPDTSRTSALGVANVVDVAFREGFIKNRYIARTFIMPGQAARRKSVRLKLNTIRGEFAGRNVLLVDDSIVRGTTAREIIQMARDAGAKKVYFCSAAPAVRHPNVYGVDIPTREELIANGRTEAEVAKAIGADWVVYQDIGDLECSVWDAAAGLRERQFSVFTPPTGKKQLLSADPPTTTKTAAGGSRKGSVGHGDHGDHALKEARGAAKQRIPRFDSSCFTGEYVTGDITVDYLDKVAGKRNDSKMHGGSNKEFVGAGGGAKQPASSPGTPTRPAAESKLQTVGAVLAAAESDGPAPGSPNGETLSRLSLAAAAAEGERSTSHGAGSPNGQTILVSSSVTSANL